MTNRQQATDICWAVQEAASKAWVITIEQLRKLWWSEELQTRRHWDEQPRWWQVLLEIDSAADANIGWSESATREQLVDELMEMHEKWQSVQEVPDKLKESWWKLGVVLWGATLDLNGLDELEPPEQPEEGELMGYINEDE